MLNHKTLLITGGTGSFGQVFTPMALNQYPDIQKIVIFSRDSGKQEKMRQLFPQAPLEFISGDISDFKQIDNACEGIDLVIHTAAMRTVPEAENDPWGAVQNNIIGAKNLIEAARHHGIRQILALSTDMASLANNAYGATKMLSDKLFIAAHRQYPTLKTTIVRLGNMFGSQGTVVPFFRQKARETGILPVTDPHMTRFMATIEECVQITFQVLSAAKGGEIIAPKLKSYNILTVAKAVDEKAQIKIVGLRPGEKLYEEMITRYDSFYTIENSFCYIIVPPYGDKDTYCKHYLAHPVEQGFEFNSENNNRKISVDEMRKMIETTYRN